MPAYISHLLDEGISEHESRSLGVETLFTDSKFTVSVFQSFITWQTVFSPLLMLLLHFQCHDSHERVSCFLK